MATLVSYDLNGKKLSFANWISNLSPTDTPFVSMTGKESIAQTLFQWQTDSLDAAALPGTGTANAVVEGSTAVDGALGSTQTLNNYTQILRKVLKVSDTANALANYGRGRELQYQMEKAGKEIKRDLEATFLSAQAKDAGSATTPRLTAGFQALVAAVDEADEDTGAVVHKGIEGAEIAESDIWGLTYNLYLSGSHADIIMFHPKHASFFSSLMEVGVGERVKMFDGADTKLNTYVTEVIDPLGQRYCLCPNRWMPEDVIYFFRAKDWTQMVLRAPERVKLAKDGSYEKWMIEMEVGLRHANPFASGILKLEGGTPPGDKLSIDKTTATIGFGGSSVGKLVDSADGSVVITATAADSATVTATSDKESVATVAPATAKGKTKAALAAVANKFTVTAKGAGTAKISFTDGTDTLEATITVVESDIDVAGISDMYPGFERTVTVSGAAGSYTLTSTATDNVEVSDQATHKIKCLAPHDAEIHATETISGIKFYGSAYVTCDEINVLYDGKATGAETVAAGSTLNLKTKLTQLVGPSGDAVEGTPDYTFDPAANTAGNIHVDAAGVVTVDAGTEAGATFEITVGTQVVTTGTPVTAKVTITSAAA